MGKVKVAGGVIGLVVAVAVVAAVAWLLARSSPLRLEMEQERTSQLREERLLQEFQVERISVEGDNVLWRAVALNLNTQSFTLAVTQMSALIVIGVSFAAFLAMLLVSVIVMVRRK